MNARIVFLTSLMASPGVAVICILAIALGWEIIPVVLGIVLVVGGAALLATGFLRDLTQLMVLVGRIGPGGEAAPAQPYMHTEAGRWLAGTIATLQDRWRRYDLAVAHRREDARSIMEAIGDPLLVLTADRVVAGANDAALRLFGDRIEGRDLSVVLRQPDMLAAVDAVLADGVPKSISYPSPVPVERVFEADINPFSPRSEESSEARSGWAVLVSLHDITKIKRAEQMRADFVANASHELRTPLSALTGFIETLSGPARDDVEARERFLGIMGQQTDRMARLVRDLLSLSHIELDEHTPPSERCDLRHIVDSVIAVLEITAREHDVALVVNGPDKLPDVAGDPEQLTQVFQNLLANAIAYGRAGTDVTVHLRPSSTAAIAQGIAVSVRDQGEGISSEHLPRLTERFYRVDPARSRALGGTGLGLAIVKHIVNRHRGRLSIESEVGEGSTFTVFLPTVPDRTPAPKRRVGTRKTRAKSGLSSR